MSKKYKDQGLRNRNWILEKIQGESIFQIKKWGIQTHDPFEWLAYTTEELGELSEAIQEYEYRDGPMEEIVKEAVQVATLALKIAEMYELKGKRGRK